MNRTERQELALKRWFESKCVGIIIAATGFGKTRIALNASKIILSKLPNYKIVVVVPTDNLKNQWLSEIKNFGIEDNFEIKIINSAINSKWTCDFLILDEIHLFLAEQFIKVFKMGTFKMLLGLTGTIERTDEKHKIIENHIKIVDKIPLAECLTNGWVSDFIEYKILINVEDIDKYKEINKKFLYHFEFFDYNFNLILKLCGKKGYKIKYDLAKLKYPNDKEKANKYFKELSFHSINVMRYLKERKSFIYNHPKKIEITKEIIKNRNDKKIITFSKSIQMSEKIGEGYIISSNSTKKKNRISLEEANKLDKCVINSSKMLNQGTDIKGLEVGIQLGIDSSKTTYAQRLGRVIRKENNKIAEFFTIVINDTVEVKWFDTSHENNKIEYVTIDEENLKLLLKGKPFKIFDKVEKTTYFKY